MNCPIPTRPDPFLNPTPSIGGRVVILRVLLACAVTATAFLLSARTAPSVAAETAQASPFDTAPVFHPNDLPFVTITATCGGEDVISVVADVPADQVDLGKKVKVRIDGTIVDTGLPVFTVGQYTVPHAPSHTVEIAYFWPGNEEPFGSPVTVSADVPTDCTTSTTIAPVAPTTVAPATTAAAAATVAAATTVPGPAGSVAAAGPAPASTLPTTGPSSAPETVLAATVFLIAGLGLMLAVRRGRPARG